MSHQMVPFPDRGKFGEVRMIYCERCGATQTVESASAPASPLQPCLAEPYSQGSITIGPRCTCADSGWPSTCPVHNVTLTGNVA